MLPESYRLTGSTNIVAIISAVLEVSQESGVQVTILLWERSILR